MFCACGFTACSMVPQNIIQASAAVLCSENRVKVPEGRADGGLMGSPRLTRPDPGFSRTGGYFPNGWRREENTFNHEYLNSPPTEVTGVEAHGR